MTLLQQDLLAVGYGQFGFTEQKGGLACCWSLKNPEVRENLQQITCLNCVYVPSIYPVMQGQIVASSPMEVASVVSHTLVGYDVFCLCSQIFRQVRAHEEISTTTQQKPMRYCTHQGPLMI